MENVELSAVDERELKVCITYLLTYLLMSYVQHVVIESLKLWS